MNRKEKFNSFFDDYKKRLEQIIDTIDTDVLEQIISAMINAFKNGNTVYIAGNGGSAATASHMQADFSFFVRYFTKFRPKVIALTNCMPLITAIGNDTSFDDIFIEQMKGHFNAGDVMLSISASGNSMNVVKAAEYANELGLEVHAGHGLTFGCVKPIAAFPQVMELNIGHFLIGESIYIGLEAAIKKMRNLMNDARSQ